MAQLPPLLRLKFTDANGEPLAGGKLYSYAAGTTTPQATYTDQSGGTPNANPLILDANGEGVAWLSASSYKFVLKDANDVVQWTVDNVDAIPDNSITTEKLVDGAVTSDKLDDGTVTQDKLAAKTIVNRSLTIGSVTATSAEAQTGTLAISTTGRPVSVGLVGEDSSGTPAFFKVSGPPSVAFSATVEIWRNATRVLAQSFGIERPIGANPLQDYTTAGSNSYTVPVAGTLFLKGCGGGGGGSGGGGSGAGGGGGGSSVGPLVPIAVAAGDVLTCVVGAKGTGGAGGAGGGASVAGGNGGETYVQLNGVKVYSVPGGGGGGAVADGSGSSGHAGGTAGAAGCFGAAGGVGGQDGGTGTAPSGNVPTYYPVKSGGAGGSGGSGNAAFGGGGGGGAASEYGNGGAGGQHNTGVAASTPGYRGYDAASYGAGGGGGGGGDEGGIGANGGDGGVGRLQIFDASAIGGTQAIVMPVSAFHCIDDDCPAGANNYVLKLYVSDSRFTLTASGVVSLQAYEL